MSSKNIHFIGICGVATSALAIAFHKKGYKVTGSDKGFFPPVSTELEKAGVEFYAGWHPDRMCGLNADKVQIERGQENCPDFVIAGGGGTSPNNPEIIYAKENNIPILSFAEALGKYVVKENSIVVTGTWGKTTISSILSFIMIEAGINPSYFSGGLSLSHGACDISDSDWSVVEGDEYQAAIWDKKPKFAYYSPTHLILTSVSWDHADLYQTEESYFEEFKKLIKNLPEKGVIVACADNEGIKKVLGDKKHITYGKANGSDYQYRKVKHQRDGLSFLVQNKDKEYEIHSPILGRFNVENITAAFGMASEIGIEPEKIIGAIGKFKGIKRRLEKKLDGKISVLDCHAPTPEKATSVLESIREVYDKKIIAVYEPNIGGRERASADKYDNAFKDADEVIIPRLSKLKVAEDKEKPMEGEELSVTISKSHKNTRYIGDDEELVKQIVTGRDKGDVIAFLGSHGFRGMIESTVEKLK